MRRSLGARIGCGIAILGLTLASAGCAVTSVEGVRMGLKSDAFADYFEGVFRRQNSVADALADALDAADPDSARYDALDAAELDLLTACSGVNELARLRQNGDSASGLHALGQARGAPDCERATQAAAALL